MIARFKPFLIILGALLYLLSPVDLFPDLVPGLGWLDDLIVLGLVLWYFSLIRGAPPWGASRRGAAATGHEPGATDPYTLLGVSRSAGAEEIRAAYRRLVSQYHPDKVSHLGKEFQEMAHQKLIAIQQAYEVLMARAGAGRG